MGRKGLTEGVDEAFTKAMPSSPAPARGVAFAKPYYWYKVGTN